MTAILILLCLAIAGRELYLAFDRKRAASAPEIADIRTQLTALKGTREELEQFRSAQSEHLERLAAGQAAHAESLQETDARIRSLITQINDRMLPEINTRLTEQRDAVDRMSTEVARMRGHLVGRLDQAVAASLGADPVDTVAGALGAAGTNAVESPPSGLVQAYERFAERYGLRIELADPAAGGPPWRTAYYLSGRSPRGLERDFIDLLRRLRTSNGLPGPNGTNGAGHGTNGANGASSECDEMKALLGCLRAIEMGGAQVGPLLLVRTPEALLGGVLSLAELRKNGPGRLLADPVDIAVKLHGLPESRFCDLSATG
ncbi:hypothetical protein J4573_37915 [Actinomadura barringtoniae]|uniref:Uncharacterized protein n=1 Tax=Actinomadura barringtoniae TaxID=1427535 RepID=A0A939T8A3_9ACTN|nr:hypothetical protein [Actinomadura barringtoniae]MBO2452919.1 hypothetical protein [Actinomadura barringtoniae]